MQQYSHSETVSVHSALVAPGAAAALLRALQTAPDSHAYRIPDSTDEDFVSSVPGFELTGWIDPSGYAYGRDQQDPHAAGVEFPPTRPSATLPGMESLVGDADLRLWLDGQKIAVSSTVWDEYADRRQSTGTDGNSLTIDRSWLAKLLDRLNRWLIVEVEIKRSVERSGSRRFGAHVDDDDDDRLTFPQPYTKYFLIDTAGATHEF